MAVTECFGVVYNENKLSIEEQIELENYCCELDMMLQKKIYDMGLTTDNVFGTLIVTKHSQEELDIMQKNYEDAKKLHESIIKGADVNETKQTT